MDEQKHLTKYTAAFVDELIRAGTKHAVVSPGSRSTPLAMLMAEHVGIDVWLHVDERSAAFFALGMAKAKNEPVAIVCTSGTAAANYFPAVIEANLSRIPLIVITADRPPELRDSGAPQTIDQVHLFGRYPKWFVDMALPENRADLLNYARISARKAVSTTLSAPSGPVHLNFPFREPLTPDLSLPSLWEAGRHDNAGISSVSEGRLHCHDDVIENILTQLTETDRGLFVCGPNSDASYTEAIVKLAGHLQYPILADPLSQLRTGHHDKTLIIDCYDAFLRSPDIAERLQPEIIIRFGAMPVSKAFLQFAQRHKQTKQMIVDDGKGWRDPTLAASDYVFADADIFCRQLIGRIEAAGKTRLESSWAQKWQQINTISKERIRSTRFERLFEGHVMLETIERLPEGTTLYVGNSMPVRDLDTFLLNRDEPLVTMANRGANGIDGVVSTALGVSTITQPLVLVIGDLSFYHDLNGLLAAKLYDLNATIIVLNNDGGGIFSFLPQAKLENDHFEPLFGTPIGLNFEHVVTMYGGHHERVHSWTTFRKSLDHSLQTEGLNVIEVITDRASNVTMHEEIWDQVAQALNGQL